MTEKTAKPKPKVTTDRRRSLAEPVDVEEETSQLRRRYDTLAGIERRTKRLENCLVDHLEDHDENVREVLKEFMASENFVKIVESLWQHDKIRNGIITFKNQIVGELISAFFSNKRVWLFATAVILLLMGYDLKFIRDLLKTIII